MKRASEKISEAKSSPITALVQGLNAEHFEKLVSEVEDYGVFLIAPDGTILSWNKGAEKIQGYSADEIIGHKHKVFYPVGELTTPVPDVLLQTAREAGKARHEGWRIKKDGTRFWATVVITTLRTDEGTIRGFLAIVRDLTERKITEDKFGNYVEELRLKNEELKKTEERYHKMIAEVNDYAIILLDVHGKVLDWNRGAEKLKGYKPGEIIGKSFRLFYPLEDKESRLPERLLHEAIEKGFVTNEGYRVRKDGTRFWGNVAITALRDDDGQLIGFSKVTKDLTDRKRYDDRIAIFTQELQLKNDELKISEEKYHRMIAEVRDYAIILLSTKGEIQNWNAGAQLIKGYQAQEVLGKSFKIFYTQEDLDKGLPDRLLSEAELNGRATSEGWRKRKDGSRFWGSIVITALHDSDHRLIGFSKVTRDLTEKKKADDVLKNQALEMELKNHELERLNSELSSFAYVVSHDFKEPIRKIQIFGNRQLEPGRTPGQIMEYSQKMVESAVRMQNLMEALLSYSLVSNAPGEPEDVNLNEVLEAVKSDLEVSITETNAVIESTKLPRIKGISFQLHQLFLNLISNALKFCKPGEVPFISIFAREISASDIPAELIIRNRSYYQIAFSDKGVGFDPEHAERIFNVFQRLSGKPEALGTGIGLAIVKRVAINHNGTVIATGQLNAGATFNVYLPLE